jgi:hypothetical protein
MIAYSRFSSLNPGQTGSTAAGKPSYEIDLPNGGESYVIGNVIQQSSTPSNTAMVAYGEEGAVLASSNLYVINNTFLNDYSGGTFLFVSGKVPTPALVQNNIFAGVGTFSTQATTIDKTNYRNAAPGFVNRAAYDLHPTGSALVIGAASNPGTSPTGVSMVPVAQYKATANGEARPVNGTLDIGAYEATDATSAPAPTAPAPTAPAPTAPAPTQPAPTAPAPTQSATFTTCAGEWGTCSFSGTREVRYGYGSVYTSKVMTGPVKCSNGVFGDPAPGRAKTCSYSSVTK